MLLHHSILENLLASRALDIRGILIAQLPVFLEIAHIDVARANRALKLTVRAIIVMLLKPCVGWLLATPTVLARKHQTLEKLLHSPREPSTANVAMAKVRAHVRVGAVEFIKASVAEESLAFFTT